MEQTECSKTSAYKIQMPGNYPEENIHLVGSFYEIYVTMHGSMNIKFAKYVNHNCTYTSCDKNFLYTKNYKYGNEEKWQVSSNNRSLHWLTLNIQTDKSLYVIINL